MINCCEEHRTRHSQKIIRGLDEARARGALIGRPLKVCDVDLIEQYRKIGKSWKDIAGLMGISRSTIHRRTRETTTLSNLVGRAVLSGNTHTPCLCCNNKSSIWELKGTEMLIRLLVCSDHCALSLLGDYKEKQKWIFMARKLVTAVNKVLTHGRTQDGERI